MKVLLTGANGFVGRALRETLASDPRYDIVSVVRKGSGSAARSIEVKDLVTDSLPRSAMVGIDVVVHTAARVHIMNDRAEDPLTLCRQVNVEATLSLARQAATEGVKRFVFISTAKVMGETSAPDRPFVETDKPAPVDAYAISKYEAERALLELGLRYNMDIVIIRPPLVYGPGVKANFLTMLNWLHKGIPLPLGAIRNQRSLLGLDNLVDFIRVCLDHPAACNQVFFVSDGEDLSTTELLRFLTRAMERPERQIPVPARLVGGLARLLGRGALADRLCGNFQISIAKSRRLLGWAPSLDVREGLHRTARDYLATRKREPSVSPPVR